MYFSQRFDEEIEVLRERYGDVDQDALIVKLLLEEFRFTTVEAIDLPTLKKRERDIGKVYLLGQSHFNQTPPPLCVDMTSIKPKVSKKGVMFFFFMRVGGMGWGRAERVVRERAP